jgi:hypothetical protein
MGYYKHFSPWLLISSSAMSERGRGRRDEATEAAISLVFGLLLLCRLLLQLLMAMTGMKEEKVVVGYNDGDGSGDDGRGAGVKVILLKVNRVKGKGRVQSARVKAEKKDGL